MVTGLRSPLLTYCFIAVFLTVLGSCIPQGGLVPEDGEDSTPVQADDLTGATIGSEESDPGGSSVGPSDGPPTGNFGEPLKEEPLHESDQEKLTIHQYCQDLYDECEEATVTIGQKGECAADHGECIDLKNCEVQKIICGKNNESGVICLFESRRCVLKNICREEQKDCVARGGGSVECGYFYQSCVDGINARIGECERKRDQCNANQPFPTTECQNIFESCLKQF